MIGHKNDKVSRTRSIVILCMLVVWLGLPKTAIHATGNIAGSFEVAPYTVSPTSLDFGEVNTGDTSSPQTITVTNNGSADLTIGTANITGTDAGQFSIQNDFVSGQTIASSANLTLEVVFSPLLDGAKSATLSIPSSDPDEDPVTVTLAGTGGGGGGEPAPEEEEEVTPPSEPPAPEEEEEAVTPPSEPPAPEEEEEAVTEARTEPFNLPLIGGLIGATVVLVLLIFLPLGKGGRIIR